MVTDTLSANNFFRKVFLWMFIGLALTFGTAFYFATLGLPLFTDLLTKVPYAFFGLVIIELVLVFGLAFFINRMSSTIAIFMFLVYAFISGITFTAILLTFDFVSVIFVFGITALLFAILAIAGYTTKADLSSLGVILVVALIGVILGSIINIFLNNPVLDLIITVIAIIVFMGLTAYDMQKLKKMIETVKTEEDMSKAAIIGALQLYLDFINLFIQLLRLLGSRRD